ncbi:TPA: hypothetical protein DIU22_02155 [Candidatus Woesebacteria bacterium]|nr:hypothetical protein [Candidatus Woesebacteria bacterium]
MKHKTFKKGDRFKVVGKLPANITARHENKLGTVVRCVATKKYEILFDDSSSCYNWTDENDMRYIGKYPLQIDSRIRNKRDNSEWTVIGVTERYEFWGRCVKAGSEYAIGAESSSQQLDNYKIISNSKHTIMNKLSILMKKLLDKDTQILVKAGFINGDLDLTTEGQDALDAVLFIEKKSELVKLAEEVLTEAEKDR